MTMQQARREFKLTPCAKHPQRRTNPAKTRKRTTTDQAAAVDHALAQIMKFGHQVIALAEDKAVPPSTLETGLRVVSWLGRRADVALQRSGGN
jgi:hypothetical protein